jgi:acetyl/propionyl-CoA carboxylase alpha subunit
VEHPITELRTGIDIVAAQLRIAMGEKLPWTQKDIVFRGHAIECRICAEDPQNDYLPSTGVISHLKPAMGFGVREDRGVEKGGEVSVYYDPMLSKLVCWGNGRIEAIDRMKRVLREYQLLGVRTNIPLHLFVLEHPKFVAGEFDTHFLPNNFTPEKLPQASEIECIAAAVVCAVKHHRMKANGHRPCDPADRLSRASNGEMPHKWKSQRIENMR